MMGKALPVVIAAGLGLGFLVPLDRDAPAAPEAPAEAGADGKPAARAAVAAPARPGFETRLTREPNGHFHAEALVNGQPVRFVVDTGASVVALTIDDARRIGIPVNPAAFEIVGTGAAGPVHGQPVTIDSVDLDGKRVTSLRGAVIEGLDVSLLGQSYLSRIGSVSMTGDTMVLR
jgi:aspartyl protease family protein